MENKSHLIEIYSPLGLDTNLDDLINRKIIEDLYEILKVAFQQMQKSFPLPPCEGRAKFHDGLYRSPGIPDYPQDLLPSWNGWSYAPELYPFLIERGYSPDFSRETYHNKRLYDLIFHTHMGEIHSHVLRRITQHHMIHRGYFILQHAYAEAEVELKSMALQYGQDFRSFFFISNEKGDDQMADIRMDLSRRWLPLLRMRFYWLQLWIDVEKRKLIKIRQNAHIDAKATNFMALIKPKDVAEASHFIHVYLENISMSGDPIKLLGDWYAITLWECGATWRDLRRVRQSYQRRGSGRKKPRYLTWGEIASKIEDRYRIRSSRPTSNWKLHPIP